MMNEMRNMSSVFLVNQNQILLLFRKGGRVANNVWISSAGGHMENYELNNPEKTALRELYEELSIKHEEIQHTKLKYITLRNINNEIRQNFYYFAEINKNLIKEIHSNEGDLKWFNINNLPYDEMPLTLALALKHYCSVGKNNNSLYGGIVSNENIEFKILD